MLNGYSASEERLTGTILEDVELNVYYTPNTYTLRINYITTDGSQMMASRVQNVPYGEYYRIVLPTVTGYNVINPVVEGTMPGRDVEITVFYVPEPAPLLISDIDPGVTPNIPNFEDLDIDGIIDSTMIILDYNVPLGLGSLNKVSGECFE